MRGPYHHFVVVSRAEFQPADYQQFAGQSHNVRVSDDVIHYIADSLDWIDSRNPASRTLTEGRGLNWYGPTVLEAESAKRLSRVLRAWAGVFAEGPESFELTGHWGPEEAKYERIPYRREELVTSLQAVASLCDEVNDSNFLLHLGI
jgi:hypothetical protein